MRYRWKRLSEKNEKFCLDGDEKRHHANMYVVCDCLNIGLDEVKFIKQENLQQHSAKLFVLHFKDTTIESTSIQN